MKLKVMTPNSLVLDEDVESVTLPAKGGQMTVLPGHDMVVTVLSEGKFYFRKNGAKASGDSLTIGSGCAEITHDSVMIFTNFAEGEAQEG